MEPIAHIADPEAWADPGDYRPGSLATDGFVHGSFATQLGETVARHYADASELLILWIDPQQVPVTIEDTTGDGEFPHIYAAVPKEAVIAAQFLRPRPDGSWVLPEGPP